MKKLFVLACLLVATNTFAAGNSLTVGLQGAFDIAKISFNPDVPADIGTNESRNTFGAGAFLEIHATDWLYFQPEFWYAAKGTKITATPPAKGEGTVKMTYFDIPLLAKAKFEIAGVKPYVLAGPAFGLKLGAKTDSTISTPNVTDQDISNSFESMNAMLDFGAGIEVPVAANCGVTLSARYNLGLTDITKGAASGDNLSSDGSGNDVNTAKTTEIVIAAGVTYAL